MLNVVAKKSSLGRPVDLNYPAMIQALIIKNVERIPETKLLVKRLETDLKFKLACGFSVSDLVPSESAFSRIITKLEETNQWNEISWYETCSKTIFYKFKYSLI